MELPAEINKRKKKRVVLAVTNDLVTDQRVHKIATSLQNMGFDVTLAGRVLPHSLPLQSRTYACRRFALCLQKGPLFYATYNLRIFVYLLARNFDIIVSNDLDTLPGCFAAARLLGKPLVYDSHEYFTEVPELVGRPTVQRIWEKIEKKIVPKLDRCYTVCNSIALIYREKYGTDFQVVRNLPLKSKHTPSDAKYPPPFPVDLPIILYQGAVNLGRGIEEAIRAMHQVKNTRLVIIGDGDLLNECKALAEKEGLLDRVFFTGRIPFEKMPALTSRATLGLSIEKDMGLNYRFALPNKLFDYIQAGVPVLATGLPEIRAIVEGYRVGRIIDEPTPDGIANGILSMLGQAKALDEWKANCREAAGELCWEEEEKILKTLYDPLL
ncbi:MAG TPA: glycosyltransferase [Prolixibacteraceae bacterium]|nr:glycosyltransferase [Prolixibacteraceae bacterium]